MQEIVEKILFQICETTHGFSVDCFCIIHLLQKSKIKLKLDKY